MKRDKEEFKARNKDESFIKDKRPDIQLGRHAENPQERQQVSQSKKNRIYQARQEHAEPLAVTAETTDTADSEMDFTKQEYLPENPQEQPEQTQEDFSELADSGSQDRNTDIPKHEQPKRTASKKKQLYRRHAPKIQKSADVNIPQTPEATDEAKPTTTPETEDYNIRDVVQSDKTEFSRNTDIDFSEAAADRDSNIPFDRVQTSGNDNTEQTPQAKGKRQRLVYDKSEKQTDGSSAAKTGQPGADRKHTASGQQEEKTENPNKPPPAASPLAALRNLSRKPRKQGQRQTRRSRLYRKRRKSRNSGFMTSRRKRRKHG